MSWEGYQQNICANGHSYETDPYDSYFFESIPLPSAHGPKCHCGAECIWWNLVDTTNGSFYVDENGFVTDERIDGFVELEELTPTESAFCDMGHKHITKEATYKIPEGIGHRKLS